MLRGLTPSMLGMALDAFDAGDMGQAAMLWHTMARRDDVIASVKSKREKAVSRRDWQILVSEESTQATAHQEALQSFWNNVSAVDALNRNDRGGISKLIRQMMQAQSYGFQGHHLVWQPSRNELTCTFEAAPLWFFENRTGEFRFRPTGMEYSGDEMKPEEWLVTCGDPLMIAGSIAYLCKRNSLADWMVFSEKFGIPGVLGKTSQAQDSAGGEAMQAAVEAFSSEWEAVLFGDDQTGSISLIEAKGGSTLPFPALIERVDRRLSALWRGADLSSMSSGQGEGTGATLQGEEADIIEADDALLISETLNEIERRVIAWHFGVKTKPLAYFRLNTPQREDLKLLLEAVTLLVDSGAEIAVSSLLERFNIEQAKPGEDVLQRKGANRPAAAAQEECDPELNAELNRDKEEARFMARAARLLAGASADDRVALVEELRGVLNAGDDKLLTQCTGFMERLPEYIGQDSHQVAAWESLLSSALVNGLGKGTPQKQAA